MFSGTVFYLENIPYTKKREISDKIKTHNGQIGLTLTKSTTYCLASGSVSSSKVAVLERYEIPVLCIDFIDSCVAAGSLLDVNDWILNDPFGYVQKTESTFDLSLQLEEFSKNDEDNQINNEPVVTKSLKEVDPDADLKKKSRYLRKLEAKEKKKLKKMESIKEARKKRHPKKKKATFSLKSTREQKQQEDVQEDTKTITLEQTVLGW
eukprot:TRINITY_DN11877_c0_g1_i1.p1 TRINITY_DN11877_c0_g1~~TRINITY_DN11877_c0_g1_i1.p1  ORF type:complete len:208 (+),score=69.83 TRINITY_DN11877_c0_g1_i1:26-649(+)